MAEISQATYAVLYPKVEHSFEHLKEAISLGKIAVTSAWVRECSAQEELLDYTLPQYSLDGRRLRDRRGREVAVNLEQLEEKLGKRKTVEERSSGSKVAAAVKEKDTAVRSPSQLLRREEEELLDTAPPADRAIRQDTVQRSPSPAPPQVAQQWQVGKNKFTHEEIAYVHEYCRRMFRVDPKTSLTEIAKKITDKVSASHHSCRLYLLHVYMVRRCLNIPTLLGALR